MIEVFVSQVGCDAQTGNAVVVLNEPGCEKMLPIWIGVHEASAIFRALQDMKTARPLTHQLLLNTLEALNYDVQKVEITAIKDRAFLANLYVVEKGLPGKFSLKKNDVKIIDARPSDAIVLALLSSAPIYVAPLVLEQAAVTVTETQADEREREDGHKVEQPMSRQDLEFKRFVQGLKASDFKLPEDPPAGC
jgi:uncharacterized protein